MPRCPSCLLDSEECNCTIQCDICGGITNHSTLQHKLAARPQDPEEEEEDEEPDPGDYDETREAP